MIRTQRFDRNGNKLYPLSTWKNQHNFMLVSNVCKNAMGAMEIGDVPYDEAEYERLEALADKADRFFLLELPVAWLTGKEYGEAKELIDMAVMHRIEKNVEAGNTKYLQYC